MAVLLLMSVPPKIQQAEVLYPQDIVPPLFTVNYQVIISAPIKNDLIKPL
jgi:hypothetical protein